MFYNDNETSYTTYINHARWPQCLRSDGLHLGGNWSAQRKPTCLTRSNWLTYNITALNEQYDNVVNVDLFTYTQLCFVWYLPLYFVIICLCHFSCLPCQVYMLMFDPIPSLSNRPMWNLWNPTSCNMHNYTARIWNNYT